MTSIHTKFSSVERSFIQKSGKQETYENERVPVIEVQNIYELGKLVALRFLEWIVGNPNGVIALPTGRTPEFFIKTLEHLKNNWTDPSVQSDLVKHGLDFKGSNGSFPNTSGLTFVMLDEFFPMLPTHRNSFCNYIKLFYVSILNISSDNIISFDLVGNKVLTVHELTKFQSINVDLSLLSNPSTSSTCDKDIKERIEILLKVQKFCDDFEAKVRLLGGIGFFLGGIGPDGHIAFNQEGSALNSTTRLVNFNYPTAAAAAGDLGGIEIARGKAAMTIGLGTISYNICPEKATVIIMAAGEGKASVVRAGIEDPIDPLRPSSILHTIPGGRFYITHGAALGLSARKAEMLSSIESEQVLSWALNHLSGVKISAGIQSAHLIEPSFQYLTAESLIYNVSLKCGKPVHTLEISDLISLPESAAIPEWFCHDLSFKLLKSCAARRLREKIEGGLRFASTQSASILHTAPHHDDIMLSYHAAMHELLGRQPSGQMYDSSTRQDSESMLNTASKSLLRVRSGSFDKSLIRGQSFNSKVQDRRLGESYNNNINTFAYLTSGFHSVNDSFLTKQCDASSGPDGSFRFLHDAVSTGELTRNYDDLMTAFNEAFFSKDYSTQDVIENIIFLRKVAEVWTIDLTQNYNKLIFELRAKVEWLRDEYLAKHQPGDAVPKEMQILKGCMRESEVDRVWALSKMPMNRIHHMRSKFYNDDFFTPMPSLTDDALPMANLLRIKQPDIVTVAFDPEGTGPDTHYKVLQVVAAGLRISLSKGDLMVNPLVIGYRNVWFVFTPSDATLMIPGTAEDLDLMHDTFMSCFTTQKAASFPSPNYDGPFSAWARHLQREQKKMIETLLGEDFFKNHEDPRIRNSTGFVFLKAMYVEHFLREVEELKSKFEIIRDN